MTNVNMGAKIMIIAGGVLDWIEAEEVKNIAYISMIGQRIRNLSRNKKTKQENFALFNKPNLNCFK